MKMKVVAERPGREKKKAVDPKKKKKSIDIWRCERVGLEDAAWEGREVLNVEPSEEILADWAEIEDDR